MTVYITPQRADIFGNGHICRAIIFTHFAQQAGIYYEAILQQLFLRTNEHIAKESPGMKIYTQGAESRAGSAINAG